MERAGVIEERQGEQCAAGLAQAQPQIEERPCLQRFEYAAVARFGGPVREEERSARRG